MNTIPSVCFKITWRLNVRRYSGIGRIVAFDSQVPKMEGYFPNHR